MGRKKQRDRHLPDRLRLSHGAYYWVPSVAGKQVWKPLGKDLAKALTQYADLEGHGQDGTAGKTFAELQKRFFAEVAPGYSPTTQKCYRSWARPLALAFERMPLESIKQRHAAAYTDARPHKVAANREIALLSTMLGYAVRWGWIDANPLRGFRKAPEARRERYITDQEWAALLAAADDRLRLLLRMAYVTALRKSDLTGLRWSDVKPDGIHVTTQKTSWPMVFPVEGEIAEILAALRARKVQSLTYLFPGLRGQRLAVVTLDHQWARCRERAGVSGVVFHDIRRKRLTDVAEAHGKDAAQRLAGHREARTTARYYAPEAVRIDPAILAR